MGFDRDDTMTADMLQVITEENNNYDTSNTFSKRERPVSKSIRVLPSALSHSAPDVTGDKEDFAAELGLS